MCGAKYVPDTLKTPSRRIMRRPSVFTMQDELAMFDRRTSDSLPVSQHNPQRIFGVIHSSVGLLCFVLDVVTVSLRTTYPRYGSGIFCGTFLVLAGLCGLLAATLHHKGPIVCSMVTNYLIILPLIAGFCLSATEIGVYPKYKTEPYSLFIHVKAAIVLALLLSEFFLLLIHLYLSSRNQRFLND